MGNGGHSRSCPSCRAENPDDSRFCRRCGAPLSPGHETLPYPPPSGEPSPAPPPAPHFTPGAAFGKRYRIIEEIGTGGMGRVYKAEDRELGTTVALKMIRPELAANPEIIESFKKEVLLARSIAHDNVVRIHDLGEVGKVKYVSMDFIKGEDLKSLIRLSGALSVDTALKIAVQAGEALRAAHRKDIVHQDLKPQNIMIDSGGRVYITDFGLAMLRSAADAGEAPGVIGTPLYFSPEQARGAPADARSDIYSFGVVLYEMLTGQEPFRAATTRELAQKHLSELPLPPSRLNPSIPAPLERIVLRCLAKSREERFQSFDDLLAELHKLGPEARYGPRRTGGRLLRLIPAALIVIVAAALGLKLLGPKAERPAGPSLRSPLKRFSVAVLEAVNHTGDPRLDHLREGISDLLATDLAQSRYLGVLSIDRINRILKSMGRLGAVQHSTDILDRIAEEEGVEYFILPNFARAGERYRLSVQVLRAGANEIMDTAQVDGENILVLVDALTPRLKTILRLTQSEIAADYDRELGQITTTSTEALRSYMEGKRLYLEEKFEDSNRALAKAVAADPKFALAYKKMAENYTYLDDIPESRVQIGKALSLLDHVSERERYIIQGYASAFLDESPEPALASYRSLLEIYPNDEEGHILMGSIFRNLERWDEAEREFETVLDLNPRSELAVENLAYINSGLGRHDVAVGLVQSGQALFPRSNLFAWRIILLRMIQGRFDEAQRTIERRLQADPSSDYGLQLSGNILQLKGETKAAQSPYGRLRDSRDPGTSALGRFWTAQLALQGGRYGEALSHYELTLNEAIKTGRVPNAIQGHLAIAQIEMARGRWDKAGHSAGAAVAMASDILYRFDQKVALMLLGMSLTGAGRLVEAEETAETLRGLIERTGSPAHARFYNALKAALAKKQGDLTRALDWQEKAVALCPGQIDQGDEHAFFLYGLGQVLEAAGLADSALSAYKRLASLTTGRLRWGNLYALGVYRTGVLLESQGARQNAVAAYKKFLDYWDRADPDLPEPSQARNRLKALTTP